MQLKIKNTVTFIVTHILNTGLKFRIYKELRPAEQTNQFKQEQQM